MSDRPLHRHVSIDFATVVDTLLQLACVFTFFCTRANGFSNLTVEKWMLGKANLVKGAQKEATADLRFVLQPMAQLHCLFLFVLTIC